MTQKQQRMPQMFDVQTCRKVYDLSEGGWSNQAISKELNLAPQTVAKWLGDPKNYSPYLDEVALDRALGEREVYENLSIYEKNVWWERMAVQQSRDYQEFEPGTGVPKPKATARAIMDLLDMSLDNVKRYLDRAGQRAVA